MTIEKTETKVVTRTGFRNGSRQRVGDTFIAPVTTKGKWFTSAGESRADVEAALSQTFNVLDLSAKEVQERLGELTSDQINSAISAETGSGKRKNVLALLRDEAANRVGKLDGPDPATKSSDEKDQITSKGDEDLMA